MFQLQGYEITETIYESVKTMVLRGKKSGQPVVIKTLNTDYPDQSDINSIKFEFEILKTLECPGVVTAIGLEKYKNNFAIIFEDIGGEALSRIFRNAKNYSLPDILDLMIKTTKALGEIHKAKLVHKDIKTQNIIFNNRTRELRIIDFGSASQLAKQNTFVPMNTSLEGTLAYISPEQTGRMNRTVDYRTDFYSLGITFYQLLTKELPFIYTDPMEIIHAHIAKSPVSPHGKNNTPKLISDIVMKLLQKNPEDRYQSITGILYDLQWCLENIEILESTAAGARHTNVASFIKNGGSDDFRIATQDFSEKFQIPEKLYGRTEEILKIIKAFKKVAEGDVEGTNQGNSLLIISGQSGIGKSALINEVNKPLVEHKGYFSSGKYDQFKRTIPYHAVTQCFQELIRQVLAGDQEVILKWKQDLLEELGENGKIIVDIIPELEALIGEQPEVMELAPTESQNRFNLVFQNFIKAFCKKEHPIALFLDDLQWVDTPSVHLIQTILSNAEMKYLFLILSFRDNEVFATDPFAMMLADLKKNGFNYKEIRLEPISKFDVNHLASDTLGCREERSKELAEILHEKTKGNPFFVNETFKSLYEKGLLTYLKGVWDWEISKIREVKMSENVIDLMIEKVKELPAKNIETMKLAACVGSSFRISVFAEISGIPLEELLKELEFIANEGFFMMRETSVSFIHDKVREATYTLLSEGQKAKNHYLIGITYLHHTYKEELEDKVFTIVNQLNQGIGMMNWKEKKRLIELNLLAADKALSSLAYESAASLLRINVDHLLQDSKWKKSYNITLKIYTRLAECEYLLTHFEVADRLFEYILQNAKTLQDKIPIYHIQLRQKASEYKPDDAFRIGFELLENLGLRLPNLSDPASIENAFMKELAEYKRRLETKSISDLFDLPEMVDVNKKEAISIIANLGDIAIAMKPELLGLMAILGVNLSLTYGNTTVSPISYVMWGVITNLAFKDYKSGYELGQLSVKLNHEKFPSKLIFAKVYAFYGWNINHWIHHVQEDIEIAQKGFELAIANSDLVYASYFIIIPLATSYYTGLPLDEVFQFGAKVLLFAEKYKQLFVKIFATPNIQMIYALQGKTENSISFNRNDFEEEKFVKEYEAFGQPMAYFYLRKFQLYFIFGEIEKCLEILPNVEKFFPNIPQHIAFSEFHFYNALTLANFLTKLDLEEKEKMQSKYDESYALVKNWSTLCEDNFLHQFLLVEAEKARVEGRDLEAMQFYDNSIASAQKYEYMNNAAIANELAAKFYFAKGLDKIAFIYLHEAHYCYTIWGAVAKVKQLEDTYPEIKKGTIQSQNFEIVDDSISTRTNIPRPVPSGSFLDLNTVLKASQTISGEIQLGKLLEKMLRILFQNAGAQRGFFILKENDNWYIEAEGDANTNGIQVLQAKVVDDKANLSSVIIQYVIRTRTFVLLNDAANKGMFVNDLYIKRNLPKSILCYPIINLGILIGIVYLENNLTTDAFTADRLEILKVLSSQIAMSVENSLLYASLEAKVMDRTKELEVSRNEIEQKKKEIEALNSFLTKINSLSDLYLILEEIFDYIEMVYGIEFSWLLSREGNTLKNLYYNKKNFITNDETYEYLETIQIDPSENRTLIQKSFLNKKLFYSSISDKRLIEEDFGAEFLGHIKPKSYLILPLLINEEVIGILFFTSYSININLSEDKLAGITSFSSQVATALNRSLLFKEIQEERAKSDKLLLNILPKQIANELKEKGHVKPIYYESVSIMFTDFKGFTQIAEKLSPAELVQELDGCFTQFDKITERYGLEKLKTIGDSYMCAGGLPTVNRTHAIDCCLAALEIQAFMVQMKEIKQMLGIPFWELRLGIHSGPVMGGVVGEKKFAYDVWGDAVNTASRMESSGSSGRINISESTYDLVKDLFDCEYRGEVDAKNKGKVKMYYLNRIKEEYAKDALGTIPSGRFFEIILKLG